MGQVDDSEEAPQGRERLIEAAIRLFGRDGFDAVSVRDVAEEAGCSWSLIRFYFGSKDGLRDAADERVMGEYLDLAVAGANASSFEELGPVIDAMSAKSPSLAEISRYLRRAIIEQRPLALDFVRRLIEQPPAGLQRALIEQYPDEALLSDPIARVASRLGYLLVAPQFEALLGRDPFSKEELRRRNAQAFRSHELLVKGLAADAAEKASKGS